MKDLSETQMPALMTQEEIKKAIAIEDDRLNSPELFEINQKFEALMKKSGADVEWYKPFGPNSIRDLAKSLGEEGLYKVFYTQYSEFTHGLSLDHQLHFNPESKEVVFEHIRTLTSLDQVFNMTIHYSLDLYKLLLKNTGLQNFQLFQRNIFLNGEALIN